MAARQAREVDLGEGDGVGGAGLEVDRPVGQVAQVADEVVLGGLGLLERGSPERSRPEPPAAGGVAARLARLHLDDEEAVLGMDDEEVDLGVVRGPAGRVRATSGRCGKGGTRGGGRRGDVVDVALGGLAAGLGDLLDRNLIPRSRSAQRTARSSVSRLAVAIGGRGRAALSPRRPGAGRSRSASWVPGSSIAGPRDRAVPSADLSEGGVIGRDLLVNGSVEQIRAIALDDRTVTRSQGESDDASREWIDMRDLEHRLDASEAVELDQFPSHPGALSSIVVELRTVDCDPLDEQGQCTRRQGSRQDLSGLY